MICLCLICFDKKLWPNKQKGFSGDGQKEFFPASKPFILWSEKIKQNKNFNLSSLQDVGIKFEKNTLYVLGVKKFREWRHHTDLETS